MRNVIIIEPDRIIAKCIAESLSKQNIESRIASNAQEAVVLADSRTPDAVIIEISLPGHSGSEFIYEFRTYDDWQDVPIVIYSSMDIEFIKQIYDWTLLEPIEYLYKPDRSLSELVELVDEMTEKVA